jgi:hypothetical protein
VFLQTEAFLSISQQKKKNFTKRERERGREKQSGDLDGL